MPTKNLPRLTLAELRDSQEADFFVLMTTKELLNTRDGKPYFRVGFRDAQREVNFPIWNDLALAEDCRQNWTPGEFYKVRAIYRESNFGPQLEIQKIRPVTDSDREEGFDEMMCQAVSKNSPEEMFCELLEIAKQELVSTELNRLVYSILSDSQEILLRLPAAKQHHHAFVGGYLEHVLSVTRTSIYFADKYAKYYDDMQPPLSRDLVIAGALLHDIGKIRELEQQPQGAQYTAEGELIGHVLQGRDIIREAALDHDINPDQLLRLEHIIVSHQRLPEWGSPKSPMTPEALIVHYADDLDAKLNMMYTALRDDRSQGTMTTRKNPLNQKIFRGIE